MSDAVAGTGTSFRRHSGSAWEAIGEIKSFSLGGSKDMIDVTSLNSVDGYREFIGGFKDGGEANLNLVFTRTMYDLMLTDYMLSTLGDYELILPDDDTLSYYFQGFVNSIEITMEADNYIGAQVALKVSGPVVSGVVGSGVETYGPELHTSANAASDPNGNEADATTGWTTYGGDLGSNVFESQSAVKHTGSYALHVNVNDTPTSQANLAINITVETGETYLLTGNWRHDGTGGQWKLRVESVDTGDTIDTSDTTFEEFSYEFVAGDTTATIRFLENNSGNNGGVYVDNVSVKKKL